MKQVGIQCIRRQNYKKIGPILAIKNKEFYKDYVAKNLIKKSYIKFKNLKIRGLAVNSKKVKKGFIFFCN